jgi:hypothetical protein
MARDEQFDAAKKLTEAFVAQLHAMNDGNEIPTHWRIHIEKALKKKPGKAGRKIDAKQVEELARLLVHHADELNRPRSKHHSPASTLSGIASEVGMSTKQAGRYKKKIDAFNNEGELPASPETRQALIDGVSQAMGEQVMAEVNEEEALARQYQARRSRK